MKKMCNEQKYFLHYMTHTYYVVLAWKQIQDLLITNNLISKMEFDRINQLIIWHDNSKISDDEWLPYALKFYPIGNQDAIQVKEDFKKAVEHHKVNNFHHFESLQNYAGLDWKCYTIEMICDYIAMGWEFGLYIFEYYDKNREKIKLPHEYKMYLEQVLNILKEDPSMTIIEEPLTTKKKVYLEFK